MKSKATGIQYIDNQDQGDLFDLKIEVVRDENGKILSGLVFGQTQPQNEASILIARKGEFKLNTMSLSSLFVVTNALRLKGKKL